MTSRPTVHWLLILAGLTCPGFCHSAAPVTVSFDHLVRPAPSRRNIDTAALWLRLRNNTPAVLQVLATAPEAGGDGVELVHEIVEDGARKPGSGWISPPERYSPISEATTIQIQPHAELLFSVPLNHVGPSWRLRIAFGPRPQDTVDFTWADVPPKERAAWKIASGK